MSKMPPYLTVKEMHVEDKTLVMTFGMCWWHPVLWWDIARLLLKQIHH